MLNLEIQLAWSMLATVRVISMIFFELLKPKIATFWYESRWIVGLRMRRLRFKRQ